MNEKLIWRAAVKYRNWMVAQAQHPIYDGQAGVSKNLKTVIDKVSEMEMWAKRFFIGNTQRVQVNPWEPDVKHSGLLSPDVYKDIAADMIPDLGNDVITYAKTVVEMFKVMAKDGEVIPLSIKEAVEEIRIISEAWDEVKLRGDILSVLISDVTLSDGTEEVDLGSFWIHLDLSEPLYKLRIESNDEITSEGGYYHPHVSQRKLCTGEGGDPMNNAICQGRLEDYFRVVEAVLRTYNEQSPHEKLEQWYNPNHEDQFRCYRCEEWYSDDNCCYCEGCDRCYCEHCSDGGCCIECSNWRCSECSTTCNNCNETVCNNCLQTCHGCENTSCGSCLTACVSCTNNFCGSCTQSCAYCGDTTCDDCRVECGHCGDNNCHACVDQSCNECGKDICKECQTSCEHCGTPMCQSCEEEHSCLLAEITNE